MITTSDMKHAMRIRNVLRDLRIAVRAAHIDKLAVRIRCAHDSDYCCIRKNPSGCTVIMDDPRGVTILDTSLE